MKDFDLRTRMFKHRCSYMIHSPVLAGLPKEMKERVYQRLGKVLSLDKPDRDYAYLPQAEKKAIRDILKATLKDWPGGW